MPYPTLNRLKFSRDANMNLVTFIVNVPAASDALVLAANVAQVYTIPAGANKLMFSCGDEYWIMPDGVAAIPVANNDAGTAPLRSPAALGVYGHTTLGFIAPRDCVVQISVYK